MSALLSRLQADLASARKAQDRPAVLAIGTAIADVRNREIELRRPVTDDDVTEVVRRSIKRRREAIEMYASARRDDLAAKERAEAALLERYLPEQVGEAEVRAAVREAIAGGAANLGAVMGRVMPTFKGRAEGSTINAIAREELGKQT